MKTSILKFISILGAILFTFFFYEKNIGLNLVLFELIFVIFTVYVKGIDLNNRLSIFSTISLFLSAIFLLITHSLLTIGMNFVTLLLFIGVNIYPNSKSIATSIFMGVSTFFSSQKRLFVIDKTTVEEKRSFGNRIWRFRLYLVPLILILLFITFYRNSNPVFDDFILGIGKYFPNFDWLQDLNIWLILTFILGILISNTLYLPVLNTNLESKDQRANEILFRKKRRSIVAPRVNGLSNELKSAVFLFIGLNIILLILNFTDIYYVWFNFSWKQETLKEFVHEGTFYLLFSILLSVALVLYYFRGNLNFYAKNTFLKKLCTFWLAQNVLLTFSVGVRNFWYIKYFSLAHLRIGLGVFLILTIIGLITVMHKVNRTKSVFHLVKTNSMAVFSVLLITSFVNWDSVIARYNRASIGKSFYHLDYMSELSDKTLPLLELSNHELDIISQFHEEKYYFERGVMGQAQYSSKIMNRKKQFIKEWEKKHFLSWNLADQRAYNMIKEE